MEFLRVSLGLAVVFAGLVGLNLYVFLFGQGTSVKDVLQSSVIPRSAQTPRPVEVAEPPPVREGVEEQKLRRGDTLGEVLRREGAAPQDADAIVRALRKLFDPRTAQAGQPYRIEKDDSGAVSAFELVPSRVETLRVERHPDGGFVASRREKELRTEVVTVGGVIEKSLYEAIEAVGEDPSLVGFFVEVFSWDIDFYVDQHPGDSFKVVVEKRYLEDEFCEWGRVLAAEYSGRVGSYRVFRHEGGGGRPSYYDEAGRSAERSLLKTPLQYKRISSRFGKRYHPILHRHKGHMGVDFAAPRGTPVRATAAGRVAFAGHQKGPGNMVVISHPSGLQSIYMHLSKFKRGLRQGQLVDQRQVIGYVGSTGLATGPHLHFGLRKNGRYIDPLRHKGDRGRPIPRGALAAYKRKIEPHRAALAALDPRRPQRQAARGLTILR